MASHPNSEVEQQLEKINSYIEIVKAMQQLSNKTLFLLNFHSGKCYYYTQDTKLALELKQFEGVNLINQVCYKNDSLTVLQLQHILKKLYDSLSSEEKTSLTIGFSFRIQKNIYRCRIKPMDQEIALGEYYLPPQNIKNPIGALIGINKDERFLYDAGRDKWIRATLPQFSSDKTNVLFLSEIGYSIKEIANRLCLSEATIKKYRQHIFEALHANNITEAIATAKLSHIL